MIALLLCTLIDAHLLGADAFNVRLAATQRLEARGLLALPALLPASLSHDLEQRRRATRLVEIARLRASWRVDEAARSLAHRVPSGILAAWLLYGPSMQDDSDLSAPWQGLFAQLPITTRRALGLRLLGWSCESPDILLERINYERCRIRGSVQ